MASSLPDELWRTIMELGIERHRLTFKDLCSLSMTSRRLHRLSAEPYLWYSLLSYDYPSQNWHSSSSSSAKSVYKRRKTTMFAFGKHVEIKGFGKWLGTTLVGNVVDYFNKTRYIVNLWNIIDPDHSGDYDNKPKDDDYCLIKQDQFQIIHPRFVHDAWPDQSGQEFSIGDVVDWNEICVLKKGVIIDKSFNPNERNPDYQWTYSIKLEDSGEVEEDYSYRISPHREWI